MWQTLLRWRMRRCPHRRFRMPVRYPSGCSAGAAVPYPRNLPAGCCRWTIPMDGVHVCSRSRQLHDRQKTRNRIDRVYGIPYFAIQDPPYCRNRRMAVTAGCRAVHHRCPSDRSGLWTQCVCMASFTLAACSARSDLSSSSERMVSTFQTSTLS